MKKLFIKIASAFATTLLVSNSLFAQTARVQIIHNSADAAAATVDIYVNGVLSPDLTGVAFRTATPFDDVPAGVPLAIGIAPGGSDGPSDILRTFNVTFDANAKYVVVANGIVSPTGYSPATDFGLNVYPLGQEAAGSGSNTDVLVIHGSTDAPTVDVANVTTLPSSTLIDDLEYGEFSGYAALPTADYRIQVRTSNGITPVAEYSAPLQTLNLQGQALVVVASGFLNPANNSNGPAFGLYAALPTGGALVQLPSAPISTARVQVIHNCADAIAGTVDIYINDTYEFLDNVTFRSATGFIEVPAGDGTIKICAPNSTSSANPLFTKNVTVPGGASLYAIASGITNPAGGYTPYVPFDIVLINNALEVGSSPSATDVRAFHGATDAPTVDVFEVTTSVNNAINDLAYGNASAILPLPVADYLIQVRTSDGVDAVAEYSAPLQTLTLGGQSLLVLASGFLNPLVNNNGAEFGLYVALPSGGNLVELPSAPISTARVQIIHNAAAPAANEVDVVINGNTALDNFAFREATPFLDLKVASYNIEVKTPDGATTVGSVPNFTPEGGEKYVILAQGVVGNGFETNSDPDADDNAFGFYVYQGAVEKSSANNTVSFIGVHGSTDAPKVDIIARGVATLLDNVSYGDITSDYITVPASAYTLDITPAADNATIVATYNADLSGLGGKAAVVFASGFLSPANDNNGPAFSLCYALADGTTGCFSNVTSVNENTIVANSAMYPNPADNMVTLEYTLNEKTDLTVRVVDVTGRVIENNYYGNQTGLQRTNIDLANYNNGIYFIQLISGNNTISKKLVVSK